MDSVTRLLREVHSQSFAGGLLTKKKAVFTAVSRF